MAPYVLRNLKTARGIRLLDFRKSARRENALARHRVLHEGARGDHPYARLLELRDELAEDRVRVLDGHLGEPLAHDGAELAAEQRERAHLPGQHRAVVAVLGGPAYRDLALAYGEREDMVSRARRRALAGALHRHHVDRLDSGALRALDEEPRVFARTCDDDELLHFAARRICRVSPGTAP